MTELFIKDKIVPDYIIDDILYEVEGIQGYDSVTIKGTVKRDRSSISKRLEPDIYADLCKILENFCQRIDPKYIPEYLILKEFEHLKYGISDHFKAHKDAVPNSNPKKIRRFTTVTLLSKSLDLEGGDLFVFDENLNQIDTNLGVGETVVFYSTTLHQVTPIIKGGREVLVGWIYDR